MNIKSNPGSLDATLPMVEDKDADVFIFVDEDITRPLKSLLVYDGYDRKDEMVTNCLATMHKIKYGYQLWPRKAELEREMGKEIVELLYEGNIKVHALLDTPGGLVAQGNEVIWAMLYCPDSDAYITCEAKSMGASIAEYAVTRHGWEGGVMMWHLTSDIIADPNSPANIEKAAQQMDKIKRFLYLNSNEKNKNALMYKVDCAIHDPRSKDNAVYLRNNFLYEAGIIHVNHFTLPGMHTSLCLSTGIYHEEVHKFFTISEEAVKRYGKYRKNYERKSISLKELFFGPPEYKQFYMMRKEIRDEFESKVRLK